MKVRVAIVAAMEREIQPLIAGWQVVRRSYDGREFKFFENGEAVAVCGGIGAAAARRACQAVFAVYSPGVVFSVGFAGALTRDLHVGDIVVPAKVTDSGDGSGAVTGMGLGTLVSTSVVADPAQAPTARRTPGRRLQIARRGSYRRGAPPRPPRPSISSCSARASFV